ncbi:MAG: potassium/proton antiporter [Bacteroidales bacterium]|nr:potassium/proton antiporter [Bacteroidales bacterium]
MFEFILLASVIVLVCVMLNNISSRIGIPVLFPFIVLGLILGELMYNPTLISLSLDIGYACEGALAIIVFYGGFSTRWETARGSMRHSLLLATVGAILMVDLTALICHFLLGMNLKESFLIGAILGSTDAAAVISVLRSKGMALKNDIGPVLQVESAANDPVAKIVTSFLISMLLGMRPGALIWQVAGNIIFGLLVGGAVAWLAQKVLHMLESRISGLDSIFLVGVCLFAFAFSEIIGGNGFISVYIAGLYLGNNEISDKRNLVNFFDGLTMMMQLLIFFSLGVFAKIKDLGDALLPAIAIYLIINLISRPLSVFAVLFPGKKFPIRQQIFISFSGVRGAPSIVFAILATTSGIPLKSDIFSIVFLVVVLSSLINGMLIPTAAKLLKVQDTGENSLRSFNDFADQTSRSFHQMNIRAEDPWCGRRIMDLGFSKDILVCHIFKKDGSAIIPNGHTVLENGDKAIICSEPFDAGEKMKIVRKRLYKKDPWVGKAIRECPIEKTRVIVVIRGEETIMAHGSTVLQEGDVLYINRTKL